MSEGQFQNPDEVRSKEVPARPKDYRRFWKKVVELPNGCWHWTAYKNPAGYGQFHCSRRDHLAHRWSYTNMVGPIPDGLVLDHLCRNPACVNPDHLEVVTHHENIMRGDLPKTHCLRGHPYSGDNLGTRKSKLGYQGVGRYCKQCSRARDRARYPERKAARERQGQSD